MLMRGTPKNRFSLAEIRAKNRTAKVQRPTRLGAPSAEMRQNAKAKVPRSAPARARRWCRWRAGSVPSKRCCIGRAGRCVFGPVMTPDRKASSIQPQIASAERKRDRRPRGAVVAQRAWCSPRTDPAARAGQGSPTTDGHRRPSVGALDAPQDDAPVENHQTEGDNSAIQGLVMRGTPRRRDAAQVSRPSRRPTRSPV